MRLVAEILTALLSRPRQNGVVVCRDEKEAHRLFDELAETLEFGGFLHAKATSLARKTAVTTHGSRVLLMGPEGARRRLQGFHASFFLNWARFDDWHAIEDLRTVCLYRGKTSDKGA